MHEYSIVQSLIARVEEEARLRGAERVLAIEVRIGELSGVEVELLRTAYSLFRETGPYRDTELRIEEIGARWACPRCDEGPAPGGSLRCPACSRPLRLVAGDEILLQRIEMEVA
jgi:hydrogenase nickel incorporation protein HypA/HybF